MIPIEILIKNILFHSSKVISSPHSIEPVRMATATDIAEILRD